MNINPALSAGPLDTLLANCNSGYIDVYNGAKPTNTLTAIGSQTLLGTLRFGAAAFGAASTTTGAATAGAITADSAANASGTPNFVRVRTSDGTTIFADFPAGVGSGAFNFSQACIVGEPIQLTSAVITITP